MWVSICQSQVTEVALTNVHCVLEIRFGPLQQVRPPSVQERDSHLATLYVAEEIFFKEMMTWNLIKYTIAVLVALKGQDLLKDYVGIIDKIEAYPELGEHWKADLSAVCCGD